MTKKQKLTESRFDDPKFMKKRELVLARDPSLASCYPWCTPEDEAEFYAAIGRGTEKYGLQFTRPAAPAVQTPAAPEPQQAKPRPPAARGKGRKSPDEK
jgi:hypothetical protein